MAGGGGYVGEVEDAKSISGLGNRLSARIPRAAREKVCSLHSKEQQRTYSRDKFHWWTLFQFDYDTTSLRSERAEARRNSIAVCVGPLCDAQTGSTPGEPSETAGMNQLQESLANPPIQTISTQGLPSFQLRRWQRVGRLMGIALGLRLIAHSKMAASDPEIDDILKRGECDSSSSSVSGSSSPGSRPESPSPGQESSQTPKGRQTSFESQSRKSYAQRARERRKRRCFQRADSDTQSDYILEADPLLLEQMRTFGPTSSFRTILPLEFEGVKAASVHYTAARIRPDTPRPSPTKSKENMESYDKLGL